MRKLLLFLFLTIVTSAFADPCVVVNTTEGETVFFFSENPRFTYDGQIVKLSTTKLLLEYAPSNIISVKLENRVNTGIDTVKEKKKITYDISDTKIIIRGCSAGESVRLYTTNGASIVKAYASGNGDASINLSSLQKGIYIIKTRTSSFKIIRK